MNKQAPTLLEDLAASPVTGLAATSDRCMIYLCIKKNCLYYVKDDCVETYVTIEQQIYSLSNHAATHSDKSDILYVLGHPSDALGASCKTISLDPCHMADKNSAIALLAVGEHKEMLTSSEQAVSLDADNAVSYTIMGFMLDALVQFDEALVALNHKVSLDPKNMYMYRISSVAFHSTKSLKNELLNLDCALDLTQMTQSALLEVSP